MNFYYNASMNLCAEEKWVVAYLVINGYCTDEEEALEGLRYKRVFFDWFDCEVSNTIYEEVGKLYGVI